MAGCDLKELTQKLGSMIENQFLIEFGGEVGPASNLFAMGLIDSFGFVELVAAIEAEFAVEIPDEALTSGRMVSLDGMAELVASLIG